MSSASHTKKKRIFIWLSAGFCCVILISAAIAGYYLKRGVGKESLTVGSIVFSDSFLIWTDKLELHIADVSVGTAEKPEEVKTSSDIGFVKQGVKAGYYLARVFSRFTIERLVIGENQFNVDLKRENADSYLLVIGSDSATVRSTLIFNKDTVDAEIVEAVSSDFNTEINGTLQLDSVTEELTGSLSALINGSFPVTVNFVADNKQIFFQGTEAGEIREIKSLVDLFGLRHNIQCWITDYLSGSRYHLKYFSGTIPWDNPIAILDSLEAEVRVDDTEYVFAQGLEPIKGRYTDVSFQKGVLEIKPHDATFYGQSGGESWLDINFNDPKHILLTAYIKTRAVLNDDILTLLNHYKIGVPFKQVEGKTAADLRLAITLNKLKVEAQGSFEIDDGVIEWGEKNFRAEHARVRLLNSDITIDSLKLSHADMLTARVNGSIQAKKKTGDLNITLEQLELLNGKSHLGIDPALPAYIRYHFTPGDHILEVGPSSWKLDSSKITIGEFRGPVSLGDLAMEIPKVHLQSSSGILVELSGYISMKKRQVDLLCNLLEYNVKGLKLLSPHLAINIEYDKGLVIGTEEISEWELSNMPVTLYPSLVSFGDDTLRIDKSRISYGTLFDSYLSGYYNRQEKKGLFSLEKIDVINENLEKELHIGNRADVEITRTGETFVVYVPVLDLKFSIDQKKNWSAEFDDLSKTYSRLSLQRKSKIREGSLVISSVNGKKPYTFTADIIAPYPLLVESDTPIVELHVAGELTDNGVFALVNDDLEINYVENCLTINSSKYGYNLPAITKLLKELPKPSPGKGKQQVYKKPFQVELKASNSQVYLSTNSRALADTIALEFFDGKLLMELIHGPGKILLQFEKGKFLLDGDNLNDEFMGALIQRSRFNGGRMSLSSSGSFNEFSTVLTIEDTVLSGLASLNNVMALLNTVPALVTFSLPEYDMGGLPINSVLVGMKYKDRVATFESLEVLSPEMQGKGTGEIDFVNETLDMDVSIKTQASRNVGKIPAVGFIIAGDDDDASLGLKIEGGYDDPEVSTSVVKDVIAYPIEILHRTLKLPFPITKKKEKISAENDPVHNRSPLQGRTEESTKQD